MIDSDGFTLKTCTRCGQLKLAALFGSNPHVCMKCNNELVSAKRVLKKNTVPWGLKRL